MLHTLLSPKKIVDYIVGRASYSGTNEALRLTHYAWLALTMIPLCLTFSVSNLITGNLDIAGVVIAFMGLIIFSLLAISKAKRVELAFQVGNFTFWLMLIFISVLEIKSEGRLLWLYTYPLFSIFVFGYRTGVIWSLLLFGIIMGCLEYFHISVDVYSAEFRMRFYLIYLVTVWITAWLEHNRSRFVAELDAQKNALEAEVARRTELEKILTEQAQTDSLTKLKNRRTFWELAAKEVARAKRYGLPLSVALVDIDKFKRVNDTYGHPVGDQVLKELAETCREMLRNSDIVARVGGEEFAILLPHTTSSQAGTSLERIRHEVSSRTFTADGNEFKVTISIGTCELGNQTQDIDYLYSQADKALYCAKNNGRNRIESA